MPAPTALLRKPDLLAETQAYDVPLPQDGDDDLLIESAPVISEDTTAALTQPPQEDTEMVVDEEGRPKFTAESNHGAAHVRIQSRKVPVPPHRFTPLKAEWSKIYPPLVEHLKLQVRMNVKAKAVELRTSKFTVDSNALQKAADFLQAFCYGFDTDDAIALIRMDDLYIQTFEVKDVKTLSGDHLSRAIGRIAGKDGKTKFAIENTTKTRIVLADSKIHILGGYAETRMAREAVCSLILGAPPGKVYGNLRTIASRMKERF